jgi:hypothetical protein
VVWRIIILIRTFNRLPTLRDTLYFIAVAIGGGGLFLVYLFATSS